MLRKTQVAVKITRKNRQKAIDLLSEYGQEFNIADSAEGFLTITRKPYQEKASVWVVDVAVPWEFKIINLTKLRGILKAEPVRYMTPEDYKNKTWYLESKTGNMFLLEKDAGTHIGFHYGEYTDTIVWFKFFKRNNFHVRGFWREATDEEVQKAFDKEAKRRGLVPGATVKRAWEKGTGLEEAILNGEGGGVRTRARRFYYTLGNRVVFKNRTWAEVVEAKEEVEEEIEGKWYAADRDGKWAEIIEVDRFAELKEAHKNGAVIQFKSKRPPYEWEDVAYNDPCWQDKYEYRIKPEEGEDPYLWGNKIVSEPRDGAAENVFDKVTSSIADLLKYKNEKYGNSALEPMQVFEGKTKVGQRLDDKLARIKNSTELKKNDVADLIGYLTLVCVENEWTDFSEFKD